MKSKVKLVYPGVKNPTKTFPPWGNMKGSHKLHNNENIYWQNFDL